MGTKATELDYKEFSRHIPRIFGFGEPLENLTSKQIYWIAFLMEEQYQKGRQDAAHDVGNCGPKTSGSFDISNGAQKTHGKLRDLSVKVNIEVDDIQKIIRRAIQKEFESISKLYNPEVKL
ncbi:hypothetical protein NIE88_18820 [Sporolactobacillus shoreicorticis]|uniref:Uncharacterized protein n=1 Tax=Sporolactobacillus shoreicorticis TaxID=1923877 RepID=A0ABW5S5B0_9BACL|nr:hypothetical protein [Sporolactobacillus shoreicorticis]MCO7127803.1 hypothetical protein [Sporolactobacillus shoreicorticis]